ncbi:hypothetical protein ACFVGM_29025, partial [Kitasatospora purpeofusca]|uniref:hypothetical protein n=1 Tax=Kitasatospora purpeofusca TaxID=67352 RepID=UPI00369054E2
MSAARGPAGRVVEHLDGRSGAAAVAERGVPQQRRQLRVVCSELDVLLGQQVAGPAVPSCTTPGWCSSA